MKLTKLLCVLTMASGLNAMAQSQSKQPSLIDQVLKPQPTVAMHDGGGVGGGVVYESIIAWCDESGIILGEARQEAREDLGFTGSSVEALKKYYGGLVEAAQLSQEQGGVSVANSVALKYITRGIKLANLLGVTGVINGQVDGSLTGQKQLDSLVAFFDWYLGYTKGIGEDLDKFLYIPYIIRKDCHGPECDKVPTIDTVVLEQKLYQTSVSFLKQIEPTFVRLKSDQNSYYTNISADVYFKALNFVTSEISKDLNESLYANAYACQARRLERISSLVQQYISNRGAGELDAIKLNKFTLELREVVKSLENKRCF